jgi:hypothetical protein
MSGSEISLATIPLNVDPIVAIRRVRKGLRDVRDRTARQDRRWAGVEFAGLAGEGRALCLVRQPGIDPMISGRRCPGAERYHFFNCGMVIYDDFFENEHKFRF